MFSSRRRLMILFCILALTLLSSNANTTDEPTVSPFPTAEPTKNPTAEPSAKPTKSPTPAPSTKPTKNPTAEPTKNPTAEPTLNPTQKPTEFPTTKPTKTPTLSPTFKPTEAPFTESPTVDSASPTEVPTVPTPAPVDNSIFAPFVPQPDRTEDTDVIPPRPPVLGPVPFPIEEAPTEMPIDITNLGSFVLGPRVEALSSNIEPTPVQLKYISANIVRPKKLT